MTLTADDYRGAGAAADAAYRDALAAYDAAHDRWADAGADHDRWAAAEAAYATARDAALAELDAEVKHPHSEAEVTAAALASIAALHSGEAVGDGFRPTCTSCGTREYAAVLWPCATRNLADAAAADAAYRAAIDTARAELVAAKETP